MRGTGPLVVYSVTGFSGYAVLLPVAPLWAVHGGAGAAGAGLVNGVLLATTVLAQLAVPALVRSLGHGRAMVLGLLLMATGAAALPVSDGLGWILACSVVRGAGFGVLTVTGSAVVGHLAPPGLRGRMVGAYGLAVAVPNLLLLPLGVAAVDLVGFAPVLLVGALPVLGVPAALALRRLVGDAAAAGPARDTDDSWTGLLGAIAAPTLVLLASTLAGGALLTFIPQVTTPVVASVALLVMGATAAASRYGAGHVADAGARGGEAWLVPLLVVAAAGAAACAWGARDGAAVWLIGGALLAGTGYGALQNLTLVSAFRRAGPGRVDETSTLWNVGFDGGTALGSVLVGLLASGWGFPTAFALAACACLLALVPAGLRGPAR
ncbi:MFS transporter [Nocardioides euryhalodurans]|uniref:MFS transporter n=1 Tax=Nocardioides euryhalodurans TaxID=2518370 RepID=UPI001420AEDC|nr:MFS transporter [Nocardioides euryhalodurans]